MKIQCCDCGEFFEFSEGEKKFFESKGLQIPKRCKECREEHRWSIPNMGYGTSAFWRKSETYGELKDVRGGLITVHRYIISYIKDNKIVYIKNVIKDKKSFITSTTNKQEASLFFEAEANEIERELKERRIFNVNLEIVASSEYMREPGDRAAERDWNLLDDDNYDNW